MFIRSLSLAAKGVGSQGDGTIQVLCRGPEEQQKVGFIKHFIIVL